MSGLLDITEDPSTMGLLSLGLRLMSTPGKFGPALGQSGLGALGDLQQMAQRKKQSEMAALQKQMLESQLQQARKAQEKQAAIESAYRGAFRSPEQMAMAQNGGPTNAAAAAVPSMEPQIDQAALIRGLTHADPMSAYQMLQPKPADYKVVGDALLQVGPGGVKEAYRAPEKPEKMPESIRAIEAIYGKGTPEAMAALRQLGAKMTTHAPAPSATVINAGQKGYENESKLRNDFKSEPIYKDFQDMQSAHKQIKAGIAQGTPIGDVATATKIMKLLDPGSVVRESELGIAMAAGGRMDRLQNYVQMQMSGEKLTPTMRKDFGALADELYKAAAQTYNNKRAEYEKMGSRYGLDPTVLGSPADGNVKSGGLPSMSDVDAELARRRKGK